MKIKAQLTFEDYLNANLLHSRPSLVVRIILYGVLAFAGFAILAMLALSIAGYLDFSPFLLLMPLLLTPLLLVAGIALYRYVFLPWRIRHIFTQQKMLHAPFEFEFTEAGLSTSSEFGNSSMPWGTFVRWKEDKNLFMLYHSDVMFNMLPKRFFSDPQELETLRSYLVKNNVTTRMPSRIVGFFVYFLLIIALGAMCFTLYGNAVSF